MAEAHSRRQAAVDRAPKSSGQELADEGRQTEGAHVDRRRVVISLNVGGLEALLKGSQGDVAEGLVNKSGSDGEAGVRPGSRSTACDST